MKRFVLTDAQVRKRAAGFVFREALDGQVVEIKDPTRNGDQNAKFHACCGDIAKSGLHWAGKPRTLLQWKNLLVSGHAFATKEEHDIVPGLEGEFVNLRESTALMSVRRTASLIEYTCAFMAMNSIESSEVAQ